MKEKEVKKLYDSISNVSDQFIEEAQSSFVDIAEDLYMSHIDGQRTWARWGALAACLCLIVVVGTIVIPRIIYMGTNDRPEIVAEGGSGGDAGGYSVAVYPATESEENVVSANVESLTENQVQHNSLAKHLPQKLPEGFHYGRGSVYNTVMNNGAEYSMLRIEYITGEIVEQKFAEDGGAVAPNIDTIGETFIVCVMNFEPTTENEIYSSKKEVDQLVLREKGSAYIRLEDCCIGVFVDTSDPMAVLDALKYID